MRKEFLTLFCGCGLFPAGMQAQQERPNIVIVLADDLGWGDVGFHGSKIKTPCLDALAKEGVELDRFYTAPISSPTRAGLLTGRYPNRFGIRTAVIPPWRKDGLDESEETLADLLERNGYKNRAIIGKWHLGHTYKAHYPLNRGFTHFYGHLNGAIDYFTHQREGELDWHNDWETCYDKGYSTELITREAVRCIDAYEKEGPFLLYVAYNAPHSPLAAQEEDIRLYYDGDFDSLPADEKKRITYKAMVSCLDRGVGEIVKALKEKGIMDNTLFLFFSDNGAAKGVAPGASSGPLRGEKFKEWDGGVRSPAILCWKAAEQAYPAIHEQVTGFVDVVPTIREIVGDQGNPPHGYDGLSMLPVLRGETERIDRDFYLGCGAVVNRDYKFIKKGGNKGMNIQKDFLVDYKADPYERKNAAASHPEVVKRMARIAEMYDTITPSIPEVPFGKGQQGFKAPKEWKPVR